MGLKASIGSVGLLLELRKGPIPHRRGSRRRVHSYPLGDDDGGIVCGLRARHEEGESAGTSSSTGGSARGTTAMKFAVHLVAKEASSVKITRGPDAGRFVWDVVVERANKESDLSHSAATNFSSLSPAIYQIFRKVQAQHPAWIVDCVILLLPSADKRLAQCALPPGGLGKVPISKLAESVLDNWSPRRSVEHSLTPAQNSKRRRSPHVGTTVSQSRSFCSCSDEKLLMSNNLHAVRVFSNDSPKSSQCPRSGSPNASCRKRLVR